MHSVGDGLRKPPQWERRGMLGTVFFSLKAFSVILIRFFSDYHLLAKWKISDELQ